MNRKLTLTLSLLALSLPAFAAFAQDTMPKETRPATQAGEVVDDAWITTKVKTDLLATKDVSGTGINVDTKNGVVTLTGSVKSKAEADKAVSVARGIKGVAKVDSKLTVSPATGK
ncbi:MAG: BON domain-containing protein [Pseudoxanthomonas sp.]